VNHNEDSVPKTLEAWWAEQDQNGIIEEDLRRAFAAGQRASDPTATSPVLDDEAMAELNLRVVERVRAAGRKSDWVWPGKDVARIILAEGAALASRAEPEAQGGRCGCEACPCRKHAICDDCRVDVHVRPEAAEGERNGR
jgi:hypothetical protein